MLSRRSFFSPAFFKKTITRFMPLWVLYFAAWFFMLPLALVTDIAPVGDRYTQAVGYVYEIAMVGGTLTSTIFSVLAAMMVYSCFCSSKTAGAVTSLPIRREGLFLSCYGAAAVMFLGINLLIGFITAVVLVVTVPQMGFAIAFGTMLRWFAVVSLLDTAFFGMATLAAALTGNVFGIPVMYAVINFGILCLEALLMVLMYSVSYGLSLKSFPLTDSITPLLSLIDNIGVDYFGSAAGYGCSISGWGCLIAWAAVGLAMSCAALLLFRSRKMEYASDIAATRFVRAAFRVLAAAAGTGAGWFVFFIFFNSGGDFDMNLTPRLLAILLVCLVAGLAAGWFCGEMFVKKTLKVFTKEGFVRVGAAGFCLVAVMLAVYADPLGLERNLPDKDKIERVYLYSHGYDGSFEQEQNIDSILSLNASVVANKKLHRSQPDRGSVTLVRFAYCLENGDAVEKAYYIRDDSYDRLAFYLMLNEPEAILSRNIPEWEIREDTISNATVFLNSYDPDDGTNSHKDCALSAAEAVDFWENGILKDLEAGALGKVDDYTIYLDGSYHEDLYDKKHMFISVDLSFMLPDEDSQQGDAGEPGRYYSYWKGYTLNSDCKNSIKWLQRSKPELLQEKEGYIIAH